MATIQKRKTKTGGTRYRVQVRLRGYPEARATFGRLDDAERWAAKAETEIREGRFFGRAEASRHTLADLVGEFYERELPKRPTKAHGKLRQILDWWKDQAGERTLDQVDRVLLASLRDKALRGKTYRGTKRSPATVNRYLGVLSVAFSAAEEWGWLDANPVRKVKKLKEPRGRVRFLSEKERQHLLEACRASRDERLYPLVVLAISTGARAGELLRLRWRDFDWERGLAVLHETKNSERRSIPIVGLAAQLLRERRRERGFGRELVFANDTGKARFPQKPWEDALEAATASLRAEVDERVEETRVALRRARRGDTEATAPDIERELGNLEGERASAGLDGFRFHDLRHSAASYLAMNGATLAEIAEVLGHKTLSMVKRYSHLSEQHTSRVVERMNAAVFEVK